MVFRRVPSHLRNPNRPPSEIKRQSSRNNWIKNARRELQNYYYQQDYPPFYIPSICYQLIHINRFTSIDTMEIIINHFKHCKAFSIDTESDSDTRELALIQIHSIPSELPSIVVFIQTQHLPSHDTFLFKRIQKFFQVLLQSDKLMFSWGPPDRELEKAPLFGLFSFPLGCQQYDLQYYFKCWIKRELPFCKVCLPDDEDDDGISKSYVNVCARNCTCNPYTNIGDTWSLQNAIRYSRNQFLDKSCTEFNWSCLLDPMHSNLPSFILQQQLKYGLEDCLAVTYLHKPVMNNWTYEKFNAATISDLLIYSKTTITNDLQDISDDEEPIISTSRHVELQLVATSDDDDFIEPVISEQRQQLFANEPPRPRRLIRSTAAKKRRTYLRNLVRRLRRDRHIILRNCYHRFKHYQLKNILHDRGVRYVHLKFYQSVELLSIGMKHTSLMDLYFDRIPGDLFDKNHYYRYCRRQRH